MSFSVEAFKIWGSVGADTKELEAALSKSERATYDFANKLGSNLKSLGKTMSIALTVPIAAFAAKSVAAFEEHQKAVAQTAAVLKSTGNQANVTADQIDILTKALGRKAAVDDDLIRNGANLLLTFTNVRNEAGKNNDIFNRATEAALDLSAALGTDMAGAATIVGKALNSPVEGLAALTRIGVQFTKQQKDQIKTLVQSGDLLGAQGIILDELGKKFAGSAEAQVTATARMKVALDDLAETFGTQLAPVVSAVADGLDELAQKFIDMGPQGQQMVAIFAGVAAAAGPALGVMSNMSTTLATLSLVAGSVSGALALLSQGLLILATAALFLKQAWDLGNAFATRGGLPTEGLTTELNPAIADIATNSANAEEAVNGLVAAIRDANNQDATGITDWTYGVEQVQQAFENGTISAEVAAQVLNELIPDALRAAGYSGEQFVASWAADMAKTAEGMKTLKWASLNFANMTGTALKEWHDKVVGGFDAVGSALSSLKGKTKATLANLTASLKEQIQAWEDWSTNLTTLIQRGVPQGVIQDLIERGPEQLALAVEQAAKASDEDLQDFVESWQKASRAPDKAVKAVEKAATQFESAAARIKRAIQGILDAGATYSGAVTLTFRSQKEMGVGATGAVVTNPTLALIGEAGPEAVVPLNKMPGASPLPSFDGGNTNVAVSVNLDRRIFTRQQEYLVRASGF